MPTLYTLETELASKLKLAETKRLELEQLRLDIEELKIAVLAEKARLFQEKFKEDFRYQEVLRGKFCVYHTGSGLLFGYVTKEKILYFQNQGYWGGNICGWRESNYESHKERIVYDHQRVYQFYADLLDSKREASKLLHSLKVQMDILPPWTQLYC